MMTKKFLKILALSTSLSISVLANEVNNMQQKTNIILIKKVKMLETKVKTLENLQFLNKIALDKIKKQLKLSNDIVVLNDVQDLSNSNASMTSYNFNNLYKVEKECQAYKNNYGSKRDRKIFKRGSFVMIIKQKKKRSLTHTGLWLNNDCFRKIRKEEIKDGKFYKVNTFMANSRDGAGVRHNIESVFMKNDILYIIHKKIAKDGGVWFKIQDDGFINKRIIKKLRNSNDK